MTTRIGLSEERIAAVLRDYEADPGRCDVPHTDREFVQAVREVRAQREQAHALRNALAPFASATETVRTFAQLGRLDLSPVPGLAADIERCHKVLLSMEGPAGPGEGT